MDWKKIVDNSDYEKIKEVIKSNLREGENIMLYAAVQGYLDIVKYLVEDCGCDPHIYNEWPLRLAAENGHLAVVKYLIEECGCNPHAKKEEALIWAASKGHLEVVKYLIEECGCAPHAEDEWALKEAAENGHLTVVKYLVEECGCNPHIEDEYALRWAAENGHLEVVKYLVEECKCDVQKVKEVRVGNANTCLYLISKGIWNESYDKVLTLEKLKGAKEYLNNELFLATVYNNTREKNKKEFVGKLLKEYNRNITKNGFIDL